MSAFEKDQRVIFGAGLGPVVQTTGTVTRVWDRPARDPYVTIRTDDNRTFVRCSSRVRPVTP
jgi:hypothetical protein